MIEQCLLGWDVTSFHRREQGGFGAFWRPRGALKGSLVGEVCNDISDYFDSNGWDSFGERKEVTAVV